jgi:hypothetical protein
VSSLNPSAAQISIVANLAQGLHPFTGTPLPETNFFALASTKWIMTAVLRRKANADNLSFVHQITFGTNPILSIPLSDDEFASDDAVMDAIALFAGIAAPQAVAASVAPAAPVAPPLPEPTASEPVKAVVAPETASEPVSEPALKFEIEEDEGIVANQPLTQQASVSIVATSRKNQRWKDHELDDVAVQLAADVPVSVIATKMDRSNASIMSIRTSYRASGGDLEDFKRRVRERSRRQHVKVPASTVKAAKQARKARINNGKARVGDLIQFTLTPTNFYGKGKPYSVPDYYMMCQHYNAKIDQIITALALGRTLDAIHLKRSELGLVADLAWGQIEPRDMDELVRLWVEIDNCETRDRDAHKQATKAYYEVVLRREAEARKKSLSIV